MAPTRWLVLTLLSVGCVATPATPPHRPSLEADGLPGPDCTTVWGSAPGPWKDFDLVPVHGMTDDGEAVNPVWGAQARNCQFGGTPAGNWEACSPDVGPLCDAVNVPFVLDPTPPFSSMDAALGSTNVCDFGVLFGQRLCSTRATNIQRVDFACNHVRYEGTFVWGEKSGDKGQDDDYTGSMFSSGGEMLKAGDQHVHIEFDSDETIDHITNDCSAGNGNLCGSDHNLQQAQQFWKDLQQTVDGDDDDATRCFFKSFATPNFNLVDCLNAMRQCDKSDTFCHKEHSGINPQTIVLGVPGVDCCHIGPVEIHPVLGMAVQTLSTAALQTWAFFYRNFGDTGACGSFSFGEPIGTHHFEIPITGVGSQQVVTGADVDVEWLWWEMDQFTPGIAVSAVFNPQKSAVVVSVTLPDPREGVAGTITVTPHLCTRGNCGPSGSLCGILPDGCGGTLVCPSCPSGQTCLATNVCCQPTTCQQQGKNCGFTSDGCTGTLNCGSCTLPEICGNGDAPNVCSPGECQPPCPTGQLCIRSSEFTWACCTPRSCSQQHIVCGAATDGCGNAINCRCPSGQRCSGGRCVR